ncbi:DUF4259 domain-containing protein [Chitinimonas viridis]|uniref:DUF4259 domain-containing protein n=1 Tax=Chitinimonas viridis TaxID=664880 RepID=A0ABT8B703_9NEIS|nr:DUF4259 domain-containing protein [Chitinimonas viridis]MDN3577785.1 DUF4259 domain-containing protein [Chitinimonas viridis]
MKVMRSMLLAMMLISKAWAGAWGEGSFDNDDALDWIAECTQANGTQSVQLVLEQVIRAKYIETELGAAAIVAAEIVSAARGKSNAAMPAELRAWVARQPAGTLVALAPRAKLALDRVQRTAISELAQQWEEAGAAKWRGAVAALQGRLAR